MRIAREKTEAYSSPFKFIFPPSDSHADLSCPLHLLKSKDAISAFANQAQHILIFLLAHRLLTVLSGVTIKRKKKKEWILMALFQMP